MSMVMDLAIALSLKDMISGQLGGIISEFKRMEGVTDEVKGKLNDFKNIGIAGGALFGAGAFGLDKTLDTLDMVTESASNMEDALLVFENKAFGKSVVSDIDEVRGRVSDLSAEIKNTATDIALNTSFNEVEIINSMTALTKGGINIDLNDDNSVQRFKDVAEANAYFAMVNRVSSESTADGTAKMTAGFRLTGDEILKVMDIANAWADSTSNDVLPIIQNIGTSAGVASSLWNGVFSGTEIAGQTIGLVAMTGNAGLSEAEAATAVKSFLLEANSTGGALSKPKAAAMNTLGLYDDSGKSMLIDWEKNALKSVSEIEKILMEAGQRLTNTEFSNALETLFGQRGMKTAFALADTSGPNDFEMLSIAAGDTLSIMDQVQREMGLLSNVKGIFGETVESLKITLGTPFLDGFRDAFSGVTDILQEANRFFAEHPEVTKYIFAIAGGASVFLMVTGAIMGMIAAVGTVKLVWGIAGRAIMGAITPVMGVMLPVMAVVAALAGAAYLVYKNWDAVGPIVMGAASAAKDAINIIKSVFSGNMDFEACSRLTGFLEQLGFSADDAGKIVETFTQRISDVKDVMDAAVDAVKFVIGIFGGKFDFEAFAGLAGFFEKLGFSAVEASAIVMRFADSLIVIREALIVVKNAMVTVIGVVFNIIKSVFLNITAFLRENSGSIRQAIITGFTITLAFIRPIINFIASIIRTIFNGVKTFFVKWGPTIIDIFTNAFKSVFTLAMNIFEGIKNFWGRWGTTIIAVFTETLDCVRILFEGAFNVVSEIAGFILESISNNIKFFLAIIQGDWEGAWNAIKDQFNLFKETVASIGKIIDNTLSELAGKALQWGKNLINSFVKGISSALQTIPDALKGAADTIKGWLGVESPTKEGPLRRNHLWGGNLIKSFAGGILNELPILQSSMARVSEIAGGAPKILGVGFDAVALESDLKAIFDLREEFKSWGKGLIEAFADGMLGNLRVLTNASSLASESVQLNGNAGMRFRPAYETGGGVSETPINNYVTFYTYGASGQSEKEIADAVFKKFEKMNKSKTRTVRSSLVMSPEGAKGGY